MILRSLLVETTPYVGTQDVSHTLPRSGLSYIYIFVCGYIYVHIYIHIYIYTYTDAQDVSHIIQSSACYVCMYVYMYVYI